MNYIKKNLFNLSTIIFIVFVLILPVLSLAEGAGDTGEGGSGGDTGGDTVKIVNPLTGVNSITDLIKTILEGVIKIGMPIIALAIIYCGFLFVSAQGKPEAITKARDALLYTLIGAAILLGSWGIAQLISETVLAL